MDNKWLINETLLNQISYLCGFAKSDGTRNNGIKQSEKILLLRAVAVAS
jgi:hypothetical protein